MYIYVCTYNAYVLYLFLSNTLPTYISDIADRKETCELDTVMKTGVGGMWYLWHEDLCNLPLNSLMILKRQTPVITPTLV